MLDYKKNLTKEQTIAYKEFIEFLRQRGRVPSVRELLGVWNKENRQSVHYMLDQLVKKSMLRKQKPGRYVPVDPINVRSLTVDEAILVLEEVIHLLKRV